MGKSPSLYNQKECIKEFENVYSKKIGKKYEKNNKEIYKELIENGDEKLAISIIKKKYEKYLNDGINKPSEVKGVSQVYKLLEEIGDKVSNK